MDISCKRKDNHVVIHQPRETKKQGGLKEGLYESLGKRNRIEIAGRLGVVSVWEQEGSGWEG